MFKNYLKIAFRNLLKFKSYSLINIFGLAVGIACCLLILLYVQEELSYDRFHTQADRIYRITTEERSEGTARQMANTFGPLAPLLLADSPDIERAVRLYPFNAVVKYGERKKFQEEKFFFCDSTVFDVFSFAFRQGDPQTALMAPYSIVLTVATAHKYFGEENPLGKTLRVENEYDFTVTGVLENVPDNSHFRFDFLATISSLGDIMGPWVFTGARGSWFWPPMYTYVLLPPRYPVENIESRFPDILRQNMGEWAVAQRSFHLQRLLDIHLHSDLENELAPNGSLTYVSIFLLVAFFVLLIACINFMNLATARSANRAREVGLHKAVGAEQWQLVKQFLGEALVYSTLAMFLAIAMIEFFLPQFNRLVGKQLEVRYLENWLVFSGLVILTVLVGILAGSYPAFFLARFRPIHVLQGKIGIGTTSRATHRLRSALVVTQFIISIVLIVGATGIHQQLRFVQSGRLGFDKEHLVAIPVRDQEVQRNYEAIKNKLLSQSGVLSATVLSNFPWEEGFNDFPIKAEGMADETDWNMFTLIVDHDFVQTFGAKMVAGRPFSKSFATDVGKAFILNEAAVAKLGWDDAIGKKFEVDKVASGGPMRGEVIGVVKDFHMRSFHNKIEPLVLLVSPESYYLDNIVVRISGSDVRAELAALEQTWRGTVPHRPFEYFFLDQAFDKLYSSEQKLGTLFNYFAGLTIFVGCLGLFGLASFMAEQRTKEIGIRKVLGASVPMVTALLSKDFVKLVLMANLVAWPVAWYLLHKWLQNFAYRVEISWWIFALAGGLALVIALLTVSTQAIRAALANPIESLRYE